MMCMSSKQPSAPENRPTYAKDKAYEHFDLSMKDEEGNETDLDGRSTSENHKATGHKD